VGKQRRWDGHGPTSRGIPEAPLSVIASPATAAPSSAYSVSLKECAESPGPSPSHVAWGVAIGASGS
jgi:hypothetical protein